ncbi:hypothetical protein [Neorhodopirellula lusitana]|uniref:hypothetical protein n=1 Tax=Neorhodopirellula lusitana TaxID=445327 RepID=UPI00384DEC84
MASCVNVLVMREDAPNEPPGNDPQPLSDSSPDSGNAPAGKSSSIQSAQLQSAYSATSPTETGSTIRKGSPFAAQGQTTALAGAGLANSVGGSLEILDPEWGVLRSASWASLWVAFFSFACWRLFPGGGVVVASLGCGLAVVGLFSSRPVPAIVLLAVHVFLFFGCYQQLF